MRPLPALPQSPPRPLTASLLAWQLELLGGRSLHEGTRDGTTRSEAPDYCLDLDGQLEAG